MGRELKQNHQIENIQTAIFSWIAPRLRELPWRDTRDPWSVLVSEFMLQQTGVNRVLPKWQAFIEVFPTAQDCADATLADVLRLWQGLGYPRRARNLWSTASLIVTHHGGVVPNDLTSLLALPGVGPYTARAILAFAFETDVAVVDTNIARVLARTHGQTLKAHRAQTLADQWVPEGEAWLWNQALMDLGATICRTKPLCEQCPLAAECRWHGRGDDPSIGSASVSVPQSRFEGSDRQARGRLIKSLVEGKILNSDVFAIMERPKEVALRLVDDLVREGLIVANEGVLSLPL